MKEIQELKNDIMLLKNLGNISKEVELVMLRKLNTIESKSKDNLNNYHKYLTENLSMDLNKIWVDEFLKQQQ